ncbi:hypothetical protein [Streptomyces prunicolor]|uniref:hypothetical protein n=1 Tax=Streptomyces prunicolor TaxID=67348 RepID=UPI0034225368
MLRSDITESICGLVPYGELCTNSGDVPMLGWMVNWALPAGQSVASHFAPQWVSFSFIFLLGVAIASTTAGLRMRITDTIVSAFRAGMDAAEEQRAAMAERLEHAGEEQRR